MVLVLTVVAVLLATMVTGGLSAVAQEAPGAPQCGWYYNTGASWDPWWEYWCWWPGWGWEYVFWVYD